MNDTVRIRFSYGLLFVALVHAIALAGVIGGMQSARTIRVSEPVWRVPESSYHESCYDSPWLKPWRGIQPDAYGVRKLEQPASVNLDAQREIKQGEVKQQPCLPCRQPQPQSQPAPNDFTFVQTPSLVPQAAVPANVPRKPYQIALFVTGDERSNVLLQWFQRDPNMLKLRQKAELQVYTADSPVYRARFATMVPVDQFPVVLLLDADGGHIHAAAKSMLPRTCAELYEDMKKGFQLYSQSKSAPKTGAMKTTGYSWDDAIAPTMRLSMDDCDGEICPVDSQPHWKPGDRVRDLLFDEGAGLARDAFIWANMYEIATVGIIFILGCSIAFVLVRRT